MRPLPERRLTIPKGYVLSNEEIVALLSAADERKAQGLLEPVLTQDLPDRYTVHMPVGTTITQADVARAIHRLDHAAAYGNADVLFTFADGRMVKRGWITLKDRRDGDQPPIAEAGGRPMPQVF